MSDQPPVPRIPPPPPTQASPAPYVPPPSTGAQPPLPPAGAYRASPGAPPPVLPTAVAAGGAAGVISQFTGSAGWACLVGIACIVVPFVFNRVFFFLPIIGLILGVQAIVRGRQLVGGITGIVLNVIGGIVTLFGLFG